MAKPEKGYLKFIEAYLALTAPYLKMKFDAENEILYYLYSNKDVGVMKLVRLSEDVDEIMNFFDLSYLKLNTVKRKKPQDFINGILYSNFYSYEILNFKSLTGYGVKKDLCKAFAKQRFADPIRKHDSDNYVFVDNHNLAIALAEHSFPTSRLRKQIDDLLYKNTTSYNEKLLNYDNVKRWIPKMNEKPLEAITGMIDSHISYIKDTFKLSLKEYTKKNDLDTIIKNFKNYVYDLKFVTS
jgi:hypothetical protein